MGWRACVNRQKTKTGRAASGWMAGVVMHILRIYPILPLPQITLDRIGVKYAD